jgi:hypothetical protein
MKPVPCTLPASSGLLITGSGYIPYWSVRDTTDLTGSIFQIIDGNDSTGQILIDVSTAAGESTSEYIGKKMLFYTKSLYYNLVSGAEEGEVTVHACESSEEYQKMMAELSLLKTFLGSGP